MRSLSCLLAVALLLPPILGQEPVVQKPKLVGGSEGPAVVLPAEIKGKAGRIIDLEAKTSGKEVRWFIITLIADKDGKLVQADADLRRVNGTKAILVCPYPGRYTVLAWTSIDDKPTEAAVAVVVVGDPGPGPPVPPKPDPPKPDPPVPPDPVPVPKGLRVVFVYETADLSRYPKEQLNTLFSPRIKEYLDTRVAKTGNQPDWRRWDKDQDVSKDTSETMRKLWLATKPQISTLPAVVIVNDQKGQVFPLPATEQETLDLLKKYGGP